MSRTIERIMLYSLSPHLMLVLAYTTLLSLGLIAGSVSVQKSQRTQSQAASCQADEWACGTFCADQATRDLFNGTWCDGEAQWKWEAECGGPGGGPKRSEDPTCGGATPLSDGSCKAGEWQCGPSCADQATQKLFNDTWCEGEKQWKLQAGCSPGAGYEGKWRSEGCGNRGRGDTGEETSCLPPEWSCGSNNCTTPSVRSKFNAVWCEAEKRWYYEANYDILSKSKGQCSDKAPAATYKFKTRSDGCGTSQPPGELCSRYSDSTQCQGKRVGSTYTVGQDTYRCDTSGRVKGDDGLSTCQGVKVSNPATDSCQDLPVCDVIVDNFEASSCYLLQTCTVNCPDDKPDKCVSEYVGVSRRDAYYCCKADNQPPTGDTVPPTVSIRKPTEGETITGDEVYIIVDKNDNVGLQRAVIKFSGETVADDWNPDPGETTYVKNVSGKSGNNLIQALVTDTNGNLTTVNRNITVANSSTDDKRPSISLTSPSGGAKLLGWFNISSEASDENGIAKVVFRIDETPLRDITNPDPGTSNRYTSNSINPRVYTYNSTHQLSAEAYDKQGNTNTASISVTFNPTGSEKSLTTETEYDILVSSFGMRGEGLTADKNQDGKVDVLDYGKFF